MQPNSSNLERLVRRVLKGTEVASEEVFFHWKGLGQRGDRFIINQLNKQDGWDKFLQWASTQPDARTMLAPLADRAGVPEKAIFAFREIGIPVNDTGSQRLSSNWIQSVILDGKKEDWDRARFLLRQDMDLLEGVLPTLEWKGNALTALFLNSLLEIEISDAQDHLIRKSLYHLKAKGIVPPEEPPKQQLDKEFLFFGENRIPLWQPVLLFRYSSSYSDVCDLYTIRILEGRETSSVSQERSLRVGRKGLKKLVTDYSEHLKKDIGVHVPLQSVTLPQGRYFLQKSISYQDQKNDTRLKDFLQLIGTEPSEDPMISLREASVDSLSMVSAASFLDSPYFLTWAFNEEDFQTYISELDKLREGPIILTEQQVQGMSQTAASEALKKFMTAGARDIWAFAFEKAAFFLMDSDPEKSRVSWAISKTIADSSIPVDQISAAAVLMNRMMAFVNHRKQTQEAEEKKGSVILSPQEFARRYPKR
jgi:hypothetical protein